MPHDDRHVAPASPTIIADVIDGTTLDALIPTDAGGNATTTTVLDWDTAAPTSGAWARKVADKVITYDDDGSEADCGAVGARALVWQTYQRVSTPTQVSALDAKLSDLGVTATVADQG